MARDETPSRKYGILACKGVIWLVQDGEVLRAQLNRQRSSVADKQPLLQLRDGVKQLEADLQTLDVHTGLLQHVLLHACLSK